ncbi:MAG TPA: 4Fe-4S binding protein [Rhodocyclaceae bacterium]
MSADGRMAIIGEADVVTGWAERLAGQREVTALLLAAPASETTAGPTRNFAYRTVSTPTLDGHLGAFTVNWLDGDAPRQGVFDVVLDLSPEPLLKRVELPQGYLAPGRDPLDQALAVIDLLAFDGDFEKPRYVEVNERLCAHSRAKQAGCSNCISVCATEAISSAGESIHLDPYLCQGCGTCATVCPSGALAYQYPRVADAGLAVKAQIAAYRKAGGVNPRVLFLAEQAGRKALAEMDQSGGSLPDNVIAIELWSADAVGLDLLLGTLSLGAEQLAVLGAGSHDLAPLRQQARLAQLILAGLGYDGERVRIIDCDAPDWLAEITTWTPADAIPTAEFRLLRDKRTTLEFVFDHLIRHAPAASPVIELPEGAPFGSVTVSDACTLCMSCTSACPPGALKAAADTPRLSFLERLCLQCGVCANTCPEQAITLTPQLRVKDRRAERVLREAEIFHCSVCGVAMGAAPTITNMMAKLSGHSMFATPEAKARLTMCADCRVVDLVTHEKSIKAWELSE